MKETTRRVFRKSLKLLEERGRYKIKDAVLLISTDYGDHVFELKDDPSDPTTTLLAQRFVTEKVTKLFFKRYNTAQLAYCPNCSGSGEMLVGGLLSTCGRCKGGGQLIFTMEITDEQGTPTPTKTEQGTERPVLEMESGVSFSNGQDD